MTRVHSPSAHTDRAEDGPVLVTDEWPDTVLARTIYDHFATFEGLSPDEAADSAGALLYSLQQIGVVDSMPEPGNGVGVADTATLPHGDLTADEVREWFAEEQELFDGDDWFHDSDMGAR